MVADGQLSVRLLLTGDPPFGEGTIFSILCLLEWETLFCKYGSKVGVTCQMQPNPFEKLSRSTREVLHEVVADA